MRELAGASRRRALRIIGGLGAAGALTAVAGGLETSPPVGDDLSPSEPVSRSAVSPVVRENARAGAAAFRLRGPRRANEATGQLAGYADRTSVAVGEEITFHVSVAPAQDYQISVYRLGHYGGAGARLVASSPWLAGQTQAPPAVDPTTRLVRCAWSPGWRLRIPRDQVSGYHLALLRSAAGVHWWIPFVVRNPAPCSAGLVVIPTSTYQAYNRWPADGRTGASLYYGYDATGRWVNAARARAVSHDRPYGGGGLPGQAVGDVAFVRWAEEQGYDLTYATSEDLHTGRVVPHQHRVVVFAGHDEYWSAEMRAAVTTARDRGTSLVFLAPNNCYWRIRYEAGDRTVECAKSHRRKGHPAPPTCRWRIADSPEQKLIGVQYVSVVDGVAPLVVRTSGHWFWADAGVADGDEIRGLVWGEADQLMPGVPEPAAVERSLLADSPFTHAGRAYRQHTHLYQAHSGAWVFAAGTFGWTRALRDPAGPGTSPGDPRIQQATRNLLDRLFVGAGPTTAPAADPSS
ncbi:N,N-dimethylformamidase beta subunit family domain-containing protein [Micromonospora sp. NPDC006766]|uniref:N,N-dimethylformamidase beta subunit family domain-containing protein n=1 Tax=Micromonospora sp. NPDC006766 TaxID=3154778 RepID=UPI0033DC9906